MQFGACAGTVLATGSYGKSQGEGEELHHQKLGKRNMSPPVTENKLLMEVWGKQVLCGGFLHGRGKVTKLI